MNKMEWQPSESFWKGFYVVFFAVLFLTATATACWFDKLHKNHAEDINPQTKTQ